MINNLEQISEKGCFGVILEMAQGNIDVISDASNQKWTYRFFGHFDRMRFRIV